MQHEPQSSTRTPLNLEEAAAYLNVTPRYIRRLVAERRVAYFKLGRFVRFSTADLDAFLRSGRVEVGTEHPFLTGRGA